MERKRFWSWATDENSDTADLYIFGDITSWEWAESDVSSYGIVRQLQDLKQSNIKVHINSYGGEVAEGLAIFNALKNSEKKVTTVCDGFACSAASVIFMAGDERIMNAASLLMIHNAWTCVSGDANDLRKAADDIETITQASVEAYKLRCTISEEEIKRLMNEESWILPADAVSMGFATVIEDVLETETAKQSAFPAIMYALTSARSEKSEEAEAEAEAEPETEETHSDPDPEAEEQPEPETKESARRSMLDVFVSATRKLMEEK